MVRNLKKKNLIIIFDALPYEQYINFGYKYFPNIKKTDFIKLESLLGYSAGFYPSIWTGLYPDQLNCWMNFKFNLKISNNLENFSNSLAINKLFNILPNFPTKLSQIISFLLFQLSFKFKLFPYDYPPFFDFKLRYMFNYEDSYDIIFNPERVRNVYHPTLFSRLRTRNISYKYIETCQFINNFSNYDEDIIFYVNPVLDIWGHKYGPNSKIYKRKIIQVFKWISKLISNDNFNIILFSDHGMTEVKKKFYPLKILKDIGLVLYKDIILWLDSTMVKMWFNSQKSLKLKSELIDSFNNKNVGHILTTSEKKKYGLNFKNRYFGDLIFLVDPYYEIFPNFFNIFPFKKTAGLHGYLPSHESSYGIFYSNLINYPELLCIIDLYKIFIKTFNL